MRCEVLIRSLASWDGGFAVDDYILYRLRFDVGHSSVALYLG